MLADRPSQTLLRAAIRRAMHQLLDEPVIHHDPVALTLIPEARNAEIVAHLNQTGPDPTLLRSLFALRNRFAEDRLAMAADRGVTQYVMLGCGLDTFPWRQPAFSTNMHILAVDHPASLAWTRHRLQERGFACPDNLTYVPLDLEGADVGERLNAYGLDGSQATFFSLLGVLQYLSQSAVSRLLGLVASMPRSSEIVLSFALPDEALDGDDLAVTKASVELGVALGEPWLTRFTAAEMLVTVAATGFRSTLHLTPELAQQCYFAGRHDALRAPRWEQLLAAIV